MIITALKITGLFLGGTVLLAAITLWLSALIMISGYLLNKITQRFDL